MDLQFEATTPWQFAIDPNTLEFHNDPPEDGALPSPIFDYELPPLSMSVTACPIIWPIAGNTFTSSPPQSPVACAGDNQTVILRPFGVRRPASSFFKGRKLILTNSPPN